MPVARHRLEPAQLADIGRDLLCEAHHLTRRLTIGAADPVGEVLEALGAARELARLRAEPGT
jgi:hypothetical protein